MSQFLKFYRMVEHYPTGNPSEVLYYRVPIMIDFERIVSISRKYPSIENTNNFTITFTEPSSVSSVSVHMTIDEALDLDLAYDIEPWGVVPAETPVQESLVWVNGKCRTPGGDLYQIAQFSENVWAISKNGTLFHCWKGSEALAKQFVEEDYLAGKSGKS